MRTVILFPGSFDPLHYGHTAIAEYLALRPGTDEVRLILSPRNPLKTTDSATAGDRLSRIRSAISSLPSAISAKITVSDIEFTLPEPRYTRDTLAALRSREPDTRFILAVGGDNILILEKWYRWRDILSDTELLVYPRPGYPEAEARTLELDALPWTTGLTYLADAPMNDISSTRLREVKMQ